MAMPERLFGIYWWMTGSEPTVQWYSLIVIDQPGYDSGQVPDFGHSNIVFNLTPRL
jgi:hypothetical protein